MKQVIFHLLLMFSILSPAKAVNSIDHTFVFQGDTTEQPVFFCYQNGDKPGWGDLFIKYPLAGGSVLKYVGAVNPDEQLLKNVPTVGHSIIYLNHPMEDGSRIYGRTLFVSLAEIEETKQVLENGGALAAIGFVGLTASETAAGGVAALNVELYPVYGMIALTATAGYVMNWASKDYYANQMNYLLNSITTQDIVALYGTSAALVLASEKFKDKTDEEFANEIIHDFANLNLDNLREIEEFPELPGGGPDWLAIKALLLTATAVTAIESKGLEKIQEWIREIERRIEERQKEDEKKSEWRMNTPESFGSIHKYYKGNFSPTENDVADGSVYPSGDHVQVLILSGQNKGTKTI